MTISKYLNDLLSEFDSLEIATNRVSDGADRYGLFKSAARDKVENLDGSYQITEYYQFLARQSSVSDPERAESEEWLEGLSYLADDMGTVYEFPPLDGGRTVTALSLTGSPYPMEENAQDTLYQMSLSITYIREREVM